MKIYYGADKPAIAVGANQSRMLAFAFKFRGWHTIGNDRASKRAATGLEKRGSIEVSGDQFRFKGGAGMNKQFENVSSRYGAPMGRRATGFAAKCPPGSVDLFRVRFQDGDYDDGGAYWGAPEAGEYLFCARTDDGEYRAFTRAASRQDAMRWLDIDPCQVRRDRDLLRGAYVRHYVTAALWASNDDDGDPLDARFTPDDVAPESLADARRDLAGFLFQNRRVLRWVNRRHATGPEQHAHDLWLTRNQHGVGFWDRGYPDVIGELLTKRARALGECCPYISDDGGTVYLN